MNLLSPRRVLGWLLCLIPVTALTVFAGALGSQPAPGQPPADAKSSYDQIAPVLLGKGTFRDVLAKEQPAHKPVE